jgi:hypothetical protein
MATKIVDGLFLGDLESAHDVDFLVSNKVTHIINCCGRGGGGANGGGAGRRGGGARRSAGGGSYNNKPWERIGIKYLVYHWQSSTTFDGSEAQVARFSAFIDTALEGCTSVLVHSRDGASRACSVVAAYLMSKLLWGVEQMLEYMRVKRHDLNPTLPARRQLFDVQRRLEARYAHDERIVARLTNPSWALPSAKPMVANDEHGSGGSGGNATANHSPGGGGGGANGGRHAIRNDGSGVTTTNNDISANNDSIRVGGAKGVEASLRKIETIFDGTTALEIMTIMNTHVNSLQPRDLPKPRRARKSGKLSWIDSRHAGGNKKRPAPTRSPHTGKPTPIRPPGESYCDTKPGDGWVDTMAQGRNQYQHQGGSMGRRGGGLQAKGPGSVTDGIFRGAPRRAALKSAISRHYDRVAVAAARKAQDAGAQKAKNRLAVAATTSGVVGSGNGGGGAIGGTVEAGTAGTVESAGAGTGRSAEDSLTDGEGSLMSPANGGVQWRTDVVPLPSAGGGTSGAPQNQAAPLAEAPTGGTSNRKTALDLQSPGTSLAASLAATGAHQGAALAKASAAAPSSSAVNWHGSASWGGNAMGEVSQSSSNGGGSGAATTAGVSFFCVFWFFCLCVCFFFQPNRIRPPPPPRPPPVSCSLRVSPGNGAPALPAQQRRVRNGSNGAAAIPT